jgi:putative Holliday junction resolvase
MSLSIHRLEDFPQLVARPARLAAMDIGRKTIGLALSTPDWQMVTPLTTIQRGKWQADLAALEKAFDGFNIRGLVVGLPLNMDGTAGPQAQGVRQTINNMIEADPKFLERCIITFFDERLSTASAENIFEGHMSRGDAKESGALDAVAAQVILQRAINHLNTLCHPEQSEGS